MVFDLYFSKKNTTLCQFREKWVRFVSFLDNVRDFELLGLRNFTIGKLGSKFQIPEKWAKCLCKDLNTLDKIGKSMKILQTPMKFCNTTINQNYPPNPPTKGFTHSSPSSFCHSHLSHSHLSHFHQRRKKVVVVEGTREGSFKSRGFHHPRAITKVWTSLP